MSLYQHTIYELGCSLICLYQHTIYELGCSLICCCLSKSCFFFDWIKLFVPMIFIIYHILLNSFSIQTNAKQHKFSKECIHFPRCMNSIFCEKMRVFLFLIIHFLSRFLLHLYRIFLIKPTFGLPVY